METTGGPRRSSDKVTSICLLDNYCLEEDTLRQDIDILEIHDLDHLETEIRTIPLLGNHEYFPYRPSSIELSQVRVADLCPAAYYVLRSNLARTNVTRNALLEKGIDILALTEKNALISYKANHGPGASSKVVSIYPMIVEVSPFDAGNPLIIVDGLHRISLARILGIEVVTVLLIRNAACPLQPMPLTWNQVSVWETVPPQHLKKLFRFKDPETQIAWAIKNWTLFRQGFNRLAAERDFMFSMFANFPQIAAPLAALISLSWNEYFADLSTADERAWALPLIQRYPGQTKEVAQIIAANWDKYREGLPIEEELHFLFQFLLRHPEESLVQWILKNFEQLKAGFEDYIDVYDFLQNAIISQHRLPYELRSQALGLLPRQELVRV
ncbi:MAG: hypothetical protein PHS44_02260 [Candidatus Dojkabacteria bacterium]|nr:hypothetical protein [Candidatus Dojkabacteria bacterium]